MQSGHQLEKMASGALRVQPHIRGHIAPCNGRVELVKTRVEPYSLRDDVMALDTRELQARAEEARRQKEAGLLSFQRDVRERVKRKERARLKQVSESANIHQLKKETSCSLVQGRGTPVISEEVAATEQCSAARRARISLLAASRPTSLPPQPPSPPPTQPERAVTPATPPAPSPSGHRSAGRKFTAPDRLALDRRRSQARQLHMFHRLYSHLEREEARQRRVRQTLQGNAEQRRRENEIQRRMAEEGEEEEGVVVSVGSWEEEERERLEVWEQTLALERHRHRLQGARETERYIEALRAQLRQRLASCPTPPPPLCSCASSLWDTHPLTCANNCHFYQNTKGLSTQQNLYWQFLLKKLFFFLFSICHCPQQPPLISEILTFCI